jgi:hypothetical protein
MQGRHRQKACRKATNDEGLDMASANDIKAARATYEGFITLIKVAVPVIAVIVAFVVFLIH